MDFRELLTRKKTTGEWRLIEELAPVIEELVEPESLVKLMDSTLKAIDEAVREHKSSVLNRLEIYVSKYIIGCMLDVATEYVTKIPLDKLVPYIVTGALYEVFRDRSRAEKYAEMLEEYAEKYSEETVKGLLLFVNMVDDAIRAVQREIAEYGKPLI